MSPRPRHRTRSAVDRARAEVRAGTFELEGAPSDPPGRDVALLPDPFLEEARANGSAASGPTSAPTNGADPGHDATPVVGRDESLIEFQESQAVFAERDRPVPLWRQMLEIYVSNKLAVISTVVLVIIVLGCFLGPYLYVTNQTNANSLIGSNSCCNLPPSSAHWLGTDVYGWDELGRIMYAGQYSLTLGLLAGVVTIVIGTSYGMIAGFFGGVLDGVMMRIVDAALSIPYLFLLVALVTIFRNGTTFLILVIGLTGWFGNSRIIRGDGDRLTDRRRALHHARPEDPLLMTASDVPAPGDEAASATAVVSPAAGGGPGVPARSPGASGA